MRIVVDTNLLVSGFISPGTPRRLLDAAYDETYELCTSETLLAELLDVLGRRHLASRMQRAGLARQAQRAGVQAARSKAPEKKRQVDSHR